MNRLIRLSILTTIVFSIFLAQSEAQAVPPRIMKRALKYNYKLQRGTPFLNFLSNTVNQISSNNGDNNLTNTILKIINAIDSSTETTANITIVADARLKEDLNVLKSLKSKLGIVDDTPEGISTDTGINANINEILAPIQ